MYSRPRIIPCLLMDKGNLVKTVNFKRPNYLGDPINAVKIFNEKEVDELCVLDISSYKTEKKINYNLLKTMASQAFMPMSYGGGVHSAEDARQLYRIGFEKVIFNSALFEEPEAVRETVDYAGAQSVVASIDVKKNFWGQYFCYARCGTKKIDLCLDEVLKYILGLGVGEILINSIDQDGLMQGYDIELIQKVTQQTDIPIIACGGAGKIDDLKMALQKGGAHAVAAGSIFVYYGSKKAVLINYPTENELVLSGIYDK